MNDRLQLVIACLPHAMKEHGGGPEGAVFMANRILAEMAKAAPKAAPTITGSGRSGGSAHGCDRAADDEAWFRRQPGSPMVIKSRDGWNANAGGQWADGYHTIAAAIRALRAKVEGGAR